MADVLLVFLDDLDDLDLLGLDKLEVISLDMAMSNILAALLLKKVFYIQ